MADAKEPFETLRLSPASDRFHRRPLDPAQVALRRLGHEAEEPAICVLRIHDLDALLRIVPSPVIVDRGKKHPSRNLAACFTGHAPMQAIRAAYTIAGQAARGIRALLRAASEHRRHPTFFIGVSSAVFDSLSADAEPDIPSTAPADDTSTQLCSFVGDSVVVPDSLRQAFIGDDPQSDWVRRCIVLASRNRHPVLIQGETGTGKEIVARQIHLLSGSSADHFIPANCAGIPSELLESELFGHVKGAFTHATHNKRGLWTIAANGTLFLDEIGDLDPRHQVKVLRALDDDGAYHPVGAEQQVKSEARVIAATNRDLIDMVQRGLFREDLYFRLFHFRIRTPALREHPRDIPLLARHFWQNLRQSASPPLSEAVTDALAHYPWPGNARELRAFLAHVATLTDGRKVDVPLIRAVMQERTSPIRTLKRDS